MDDRFLMIWDQLSLNSTRDELSWVQVRVSLWCGVCLWVSLHENLLIKFKTHFDCMFHFPFCSIIPQFYANPHQNPRTRPNRSKGYLNVVKWHLCKLICCGNMLHNFFDAWWALFSYFCEPHHHRPPFWSLTTR